MAQKSKYSFTGINQATGASVSGSLSATDREYALAHLAARRIKVERLSEVVESPSSEPMAPQLAPSLLSGRSYLPRISAGLIALGLLWVVCSGAGKPALATSSLVEVEVKGQLKAESGQDIRQAELAVQFSDPPLTVSIAPSQLTFSDDGRFKFSLALQLPRVPQNLTLTCRLPGYRPEEIRNLGLQGQPLQCEAPALTLQPQSLAVEDGLTDDLAISRQFVRTPSESVSVPEESSAEMAYGRISFETTAGEGQVLPVNRVVLADE